MDQATHDALAHYYPTMPSGVYVGKMWRRQGLLCWWAPGDDPHNCVLEHRVILVVGDHR